MVTKTVYKPGGAFQSYLMFERHYIVKFMVYLFIQNDLHFNIKNNNLYILTI